MSQKVTFPEDFWWGAAMSGPQMEGTFEKPHENVMDYWYKTSKEEFFNGVGPTVATDFFHHPCKHHTNNTDDGTDRNIDSSCDQYKCHTNGCNDQSSITNEQV